MTPPVEEVRAAHGRFVAAVSGLTRADLAEPTALPGWTRGHVIAHVADGGRAFARLTELALRGELTALFPGGLAERDGSIERLATSPDLMTHLSEGIARLETAWSRVTAADWERPVRFRNGDLAGTVFARWREVWIHLVDCAVGVRPADWPVELATHAIDFLHTRLPAGTTVQAVETGRRWPATPQAGTVTGGVRDLAAWLAGRAPDHALTGPAVALGEWPPHPPPDR